MSDFKTLFGQTNNNQDEKKNDIISEQNMFMCLAVKIELS